MSILIKGIEMPKNESEYWHIFITPYGDVYNCFDGELTERPIANAIDVSDHGDLIDREYAVGSACSGRIRALPTTEDGEDWIRVEEVRQSLKSVPAVIPAERGEE